MKKYSKYSEVVNNICVYAGCVLKEEIIFDGICKLSIIDGHGNEVARASYLIEGESFEVGCGLLVEHLASHYVKESAANFKDCQSKFLN